MKNRRVLSCGLIALLSALLLWLFFSAVCRTCLPLEWRYLEVKKIRTVPFRSVPVRWSPDGTTLAYAADDLFPERFLLMDTTGWSAGSISVADWKIDSLDWSPDGQRTAFVSRDKYLQRNQIYIANKDGSSPTPVNLPSLNYATAGCPKWYPDGSRLAFCSSAGKHNPGSDLYSVTLDSSQVVQLTHDPMGVIPPFEWSPDGSQMVFNAWQADPAIEGWDSDVVGPFLYVINSDGSGLHRLVEYAGAFHPTWSPDGQQILFTYRGRLDSHISDGLYIVGTDGSNLRQILDERPCSYPHWSGARNEIVFICGPETFPAYAHIYTMDMSRYSKK